MAFDSASDHPHEENTAVPVLEIIRFRPRADSISALLAGRQTAVDVLTAQFGMEDSTLTEAEDGTWVDVMRFPSAASADDALAHELEFPDFANWVTLVEEVLHRERLEIRAV